MAWVAVAGIVVSAGVSAYNGYASRKQQRDQYSALQDSAGANAADIFGTRPEFTAPEYNPLYISDPGYRGIVADTLAGDQQNLPAASALSSDINKAITASAKDRVNSWDAGFMGSINALSHNTSAALQGQLPYEDALNIVQDRGRLASDLGYAGGSGAQTAADLGRSRLSLMTEVGPNLLQGLAGILNTVDPIQRHSTPENYLLNPTQAVGFAVNENQFAATYGLQAATEQATFDALPDPQAQGMFNLQALMAGLNGGGAANSGGTAALGVLGQALTAYGMKTSQPSYQSASGSSLSAAQGSNIYGNPNYGSGTTAYQLTSNTAAGPNGGNNLDYYPGTAPNY